MACPPYLFCFCWFSLFPLCFPLDFRAWFARPQFAQSCCAPQYLRMYNTKCQNNTINFPFSTKYQDLSILPFDNCVPTHMSGGCLNAVNCILSICNATPHVRYARNVSPCCVKLHHLHLICWFHGVWYDCPNQWRSGHTPPPGVLHSKLLTLLPPLELPTFGVVRHSFSPPLPEVTQSLLVLFDHFFFFVCLNKGPLLLHQVLLGAGR